ncbi:phosphoserine phosphatase-like hydrolase [Candidatus Omnitrophus magneticus]|uniref:phosphoserine phosphatase n=1 Tax=Candidatus Omnitrophus magneticus TaxID=1609969 RepID=A0A0F0CVI0_9BACT|nr:phosphoserine phosphatase-like hydrolase [Candidatus Omnitrophus magneticus]
MKYKAVIFDVDGTITKHISSWRYIHEKLNLWDILAKKYQEEFLAGKITYKKFCELDALHWKGLSVKKMRGIFKQIKYSKNVIPVIKKLKKMNFKLIAISTGLQFITDRIKKELKFNYVIGNRLTIKNGVLTGNVKINISHGEKGKILLKILKKNNIKPHEIIAIGDTDGDIPMLKLAGYSIAFNPASAEISKISDYTCLSTDFKEILKKIKEISC